MIELIVYLCHEKVKYVCYNFVLLKWLALPDQNVPVTCERSLFPRWRVLALIFFPVDPINQRIPPMADSQLWRIQMYFCSVVFCFNKNIGFKAVTPCMKWFSMALWETRGKNTIYSPLSLFFFCLQAHWIKTRGFYSSILLSLKMMRYLNTHARVTLV